MMSTPSTLQPTAESEHSAGELWIIAGQTALVVAIFLGFGATLEFPPRQQLLLLFIPTAAMFALAPPQRYRRLVLSVPVLLYVSWWILSVTWTSNIGGFIVDSQNPLLFLAALIALVCYLPLPSVTKGLVVASYVTIVWTILYTGLNPEIAMINEDGVPGWRGGFIHKNGMAPFMLFAAVTIATFETHRIRRAISISAAAFFVVMAQSTTSLVAGAALLAAWWSIRALARIPADRRGQTLVVGGVFGFCAVALTMSGLPGLVGAFGKDPTLTSRTDIWAGVINAIAERPVQGYGIGGVWIDQAAPHTRAIQQQLGFVVFHSHNGYLEIALQLGLVGLALFAILLVSTGRRALDLLESEQRLGSFVLMFITIVLVTSISEVTTFGMWIGMLCALATLTARVVTDHRTRAIDSRRMRSGGAIVLAASMSIASCTNDGKDASTEPPTSGGVVSSPYVATSDPGVDDSEYVWSVLPIGAGGWATGIVLHETEPDVAYARTDVSGAYRYDAGTGSWVQMLTAGSSIDGSLEADDYVVESIAAAPSDHDVVYLSVGNDDAGPDASSGSGRVLSSDDGGQSWRSGDQRWIVAGNAEHRQRSERLAVDPRNADRVVLGTRRDGLWRSADAGRTWSEVTDVPRGRATSEGAAPGITFVTWGSGEHEDHLWVGVAGEGVFASDDAGTTWESIWSESDATVAPFEGVYAGGRLVVAFNQTSGDGNGIIRRLDVARAEWSDVTPSHGAPDWSVAVSPHDPDRMVAAPDSVRDGSLWRTTDGGGTWSTVDVTMRSPEVPWVTGSEDDDWMFIGRLAFDPHHADRLWFAEGRGIWTADAVFDGPAVVWDARLSGLEQTVTADLVVNPDGEPVSAVADHQGFLHRAFDEYPTSPLVDHRFAGGTSLDHSAGAPEHLVWIGAEYQRYYDPARVGRGAVSPDGGVNWVELPNLTSDHFGGNIAMSASDPDNLVWVPTYIHPFGYADEPRGLFVTADGGSNWTHLDQGVDGSHRFHRLVWWLTRRAVAADRVDGGTFYLNDDDGNFWVSSDGGFEWRSARHAAPCFEDNDCHVFGQLRASPATAGEVWASVGTAGLQRTSDAGASPWEAVPGVVEARSFDFGAPLQGSTNPTIFLHGRVGSDPDLGVWRSPDRGDSWQLVARHPAGIARGITVVAADPGVPGRVYLGTPGIGFVYGDDASEVGQ
jgi:O-antigen ligase